MTFHFRVPDGVRVCAIGDIHGRYDLLVHLCEKLNSRLGDGPAVVIYLGDYLDRGLQSRQVIDYLLTQPFPNWQQVFLKGNHEAMALFFLEDPLSAKDWLGYGGTETLLSYGVDVPARVRRKSEALNLRDCFLANLPIEHLNFLRALHLYHWEGDYFFVHAGVDPDRPLFRQREKDLLWIRAKFLSYKEALQKVIVHGHTPVPQPENCLWRINLDTGAFFSRRLTALVLEDGRREFIAS